MLFQQQGFYEDSALGKIMQYYFNSSQRHFASMTNMCTYVYITYPVYLFRKVPILGLEC